MKERQKFVQFLANGLAWRTLYSVYSRFKILYRNKITQVRYEKKVLILFLNAYSRMIFMLHRYSTKEDKKILMYIQNKYLDKRSAKYVELAKLLGRTRESISKRYRYLKKMQNKSKEERRLFYR